VSRKQTAFIFTLFQPLTSTIVAYLLFQKVLKQLQASVPDLIPHLITPDGLLSNIHDDFWKFSHRETTTSTTMEVRATLVT
jgi:hypothetical protein